MSGVIIPDARGGLVWIHGSDGTATPVLVSVDASGHLQLDVLTSALPSGAATAANQATEITALQLIDDLRAALQSVAGDSLRGTIISLIGVTSYVNVLEGYNAQYMEAGSDLAAPAGTVTKTLSVVPAGEAWLIGRLSAWNATRAVTIDTGVWDGTTMHVIDAATNTSSGNPLAVGKDVWLKAGDAVRFRFYGTVLNDDLYWNAFGKKMKVA